MVRWSGRVPREGAECLRPSFRGLLWGSPGHTVAVTPRTTPVAEATGAAWLWLLVSLWWVDLPGVCRQSASGVQPRGRQPCGPGGGRRVRGQWPQSSAGSGGSCRRGRRPAGSQGLVPQYTRLPAVPRHLRGTHGAREPELRPGMELDGVPAPRSLRILIHERGAVTLGGRCRAGPRAPRVGGGCETLQALESGEAGRLA